MIAEVIIDVQNSEVDKIYDYKIPKQEETVLQKNLPTSPQINNSASNSASVLTTPQTNFIKTQQTMQASSPIFSQNISKDELSNKIEKYGIFECGMRVVVPFGKRVIEGFIIGIKPTSHLADDRLKSIIKPLDSSPVIMPELLNLTEFMVKRYNIKLVDALRLFIPSEFRKGQVKTLLKNYCFINPEIDLVEYEKTIKKNSHQQQALLQFLINSQNQKKEPFCEMQNLTVNSEDKVQNEQIVEKISDASSQNIKVSQRLSEDLNQCSQAKFSVFEQAILNQKFSPAAVAKFKKDNVLLPQQIEHSRRPLEMKTQNKTYIHTPEQQRAINAISQFFNINHLFSQNYNSNNDHEYETQNHNSSQNKNFNSNKVSSSNNSDIFTPTDKQSDNENLIDNINKAATKNNVDENVNGFSNNAENAQNYNNYNVSANHAQFAFQTFLLHGVTGSGKTEVYMTLIEKVLQMNKTAIMLVPEISLTPQVLSSFKARLGEDVALLHSGLSAGERYDEWRRLLTGSAKVVVGARSAIFAPLKNIGLIVIDEEHESSYNSESNPRYKTHEIANFRAKFNNCPLILGSATPSISSYHSALAGESQLLELPTRTNQKEMPQIQIVDMLSELRAGNSCMFSRQLIDDLFNCIKDQKQALLFLNRRGFTSFMRCNECGYIAKCTDCDVSLVYHKVEDKLKCHYCGKRFRALTVCPTCKSSYIRQGAIGTQKVVEEIKRLFPDVQVFRMDNDTTQNKNAHQKILEEFAKTKPAVLVGTQMIAKGHDFESVSLVGIVDADQSLYQSDYKSSEKTFQLITQVSGRAGRKDGGGKIVLQSYNPKHYVYKFAANYNYKGFYDKEINIRDVTKFPPFTCIIRILVTHENEQLVLETTKALYEKMCEIERKFHYDFYFFDVMKSPHARIKNKTRYQILFRFTKSKECVIIKEIYQVVNQFKSAKVSIFVEIDPENLS